MFRSLLLTTLGPLFAALLLPACGETQPAPDTSQGPWPSTGDGDQGGDGDGDLTGDGDGDLTGDGDGDLTGDGDGDLTGDGDGDGDGDAGLPGDDGSVPGDGDGDGDGDEPGPMGQSAGCGKTSFPASGEYNIDVAGTQRMYIIKLPSGYDPNKPYKLIFTWHYLGGSAAGIARSYYGLESLAQGSAIFVSPQGISAGWANTGGRDVAFAQAMLDKFKADYCIDTGRIFSTGFSYGGIMSNTVGCALGDQFRAIAPMAGSGPSRFGVQCKGQVAAWLYHGTSDGTVSYSSGVASRNHWLMTNHCDMQADAPDSNGCVRYQGCDTGYPVVWCENSAGHTQPRFGPSEVWKFFSQF